MNKSDENKKTKFKRLAEARTEKVLDMLDLIGNLSNRSFYEYSEKDVETIFNTIEASVKENKRKFTKTKKGKRRFTL